MAGPDQADRAIAGGERLIYSNTKGMYSARIPPSFLMADDISTTAPNFCTLSRFTFQVTGQGDPNLPPAPYGVSWALYSGCPGAWSATYRPMLIIGGTSGSADFPDGAPRTIEFVTTQPVEIPTTVWLGLTFTGDNAGPILGAPALEGFSGDVFDFPGFVCNANLGGFPAQPHASFNAELFGSGCPHAYLGYKAQRASGTPYRGGRNQWFADDLHLATDDCKLIAYEVATKGNANYYFELRNSCASSAIPGTQGNILNGWVSEVKWRRYKLAYICDASSANPGADCAVDADCRGGGTHPQGKCKKPIPLPASPWFAMRISNDTGGVIATGRQADIGWTNDYFGIPQADHTCQLVTLGTGIHAAFHISLTCDGEAPKGACCDMYITECVGGPDEGKPCANSDDCADPGTCESVCREVTEVNCPFPPRFEDLRPQWMEGETCDPEPFEEGTCGQAACCYIDESYNHWCENLTKKECYAIPPVANRREWQRGHFCGVGDQECPPNECFGATGSCVEPRDGCPDSGEVGCGDLTCCSIVCNLQWEDFCCSVCWDDECAEVAQIMCRIPPANDDCVGLQPGDGAKLLPIPHMVTTDGRNATVSETDPEFCCHPGTPFVCTEEGGLTTSSCETDGDCPSGYTCKERPPVGLATVWYKFVAPPPLEPGTDRSSVSVSTCATSGSYPSVDSLLQVFSVGDPTSDEAACNTLQPIGCSDDVPGCGDDGRNGELCLRNLVPGNMYYVLVAAKTQEAADRAYTLTINSPCVDPAAIPNDYCPAALPVADGITNFDMTDATLHCPADLCAPGMEKDVWYEYTATCTGYATIDTCSGETQPDTNLMVYESCDTCPTIEDVPLACNTNSDQCELGSLASSVRFPVFNGGCYRVRVANQEDSNPVGELNVECDSLCDKGTVMFVYPRNGTLDARRPHAPDSILPPMGIDTIVATAPPGAPDPALCWRLCETKLVGGEANFITDVVEDPPGRYTISLFRPITPDAHTTIVYLGNLPVSVGRFFSHPGNTNADFGVFTDDVELLMDTLSGYGFPPYGEHSKDIDHSGALTPLDLLDWIDLVNGADLYDPPRLNTIVPGTAGCP